MPVMIDLETLSTRPSAHLLSIGAVQFDTQTGRLGRSFYRLLDLSGYEGRFHIDPGTVRWWLAQDQAARNLLLQGKTPFITALTEFSAWMAAIDPTFQQDVWGNGSPFDNVILRHAYDVAGLQAPWSYAKDRCFRTFRSLYEANMQKPDAPTPEQAMSWGVEFEPGLPAGIMAAHSALGDAIVQARALLTVYGHAL